MGSATAGQLLLDGGRVRLDCAARQLCVAGEPARLGGRAFDVLVALVERRDRVVPKQELLDVVWPGLVVEENTLQVHVASLRRLLGAQAITTVSGRGYRCTLPDAQAEPDARHDLVAAVRIPSASPKIMRPRLRGVLARERLFSRLAHGGAPITWVSAGPGAGKTTLAASYCDAANAQVIWYQIDASDADPASFFHFLGQALANAGLADASKLPLLPSDGVVDATTFARTFFRVFFAALPKDAILIIDNFEAVNAEPFEAIVRAAFEQVPDSTQVIVLSLMQPPQNLTRLVANGAIHQIGAEDLRLTRAESDLVVLSRMRADDAVMAELHRRSAGWAAGLSLMVEHLRRAGPPAANSLDASQEAVFEYFAGEILGNCTAEEQRALMLTASLPRVTARLALAMTGGPDISRLLERLHRRHLFVDRHHDRESSYQYHRLFRTFLGNRAQASLSATDRAEAADRAARIIDADGHVEDAIAMYLAAENWGCAVRLMARHARHWYAQGRRRTLLDWLGRLPARVIDADPWLAYWSGTCRVWADPGGARLMLERAFQGFAVAGDVSGQILAAGACSRACLLGTDWMALDVWIAELERLLDSDTAAVATRDLLTGCSRLLYITLARQPGHARLADWAERTSALLDLESEPDDALLAAFSLLFYFTWTGQTASGEHLMRQMAPLAADPRASAVCRVYWHWVVANHLLTAGDPKDALQAIAFALGLATENGLAIAGVIRRHRVAHLLSMGRLKEASVELDSLATAPRVEPYFELRAWLALLRGDSRLALDEAQAAWRLAQERGRTLYQLLDLALLAHISAASGSAAKALQHLQSYRNATLGMPGEFAKFQASLIEAYAALQRGDRRESWAPLRLALEIGGRHRYRSFWGWDPAPMVSLLTEALEQGICVSYCRDLIRAHRLRPPTPNIEHWPWPIRIRTLGRFEVLIDDKLLRAPGKAQRKPLELLKMLVACGDQPAAIEQLMGWMWPNPEEGGRKAFDITVHRLRKMLGLEAAVQVDLLQAALDPRFVWVDAWALDRMLEPLMASGGTNADVERLEAAAPAVLSLLAGPFLAGAADAPWQAIPRNRLTARFQQFAQRLGWHWEQSACWGRAIELYQRVLELDPLAEFFYRRQMICLRAQGRRAEAIEVFRRCRHLLSITLGVTPAAESEALWRELLEC